MSDVQIAEEHQQQLQEWLQEHWDEELCHRLERQLQPPWNSRSISDGTSLICSKPGFGVIFKVAPGQLIHKIRDALAPHLFVLKTKDSAMHVTVFHAALYIDRLEEFNPASLPNNLLAVIRNELLTGARAEIAAAETVFRNGTVSMSVQPGNTWLLVGHGYPSHLAVMVDYSQARDILETLKNTLHVITNACFLVVSTLIRKHGFYATMRDNETMGQHLCGEGWRLSVMFTGKSDYKSHVTLGMLRAENKNGLLDGKVVEANASCPDAIEPVFSSLEESCGSVGAHALAAEVETLKWVHAMSYYNSVATEISSNPITGGVKTVDQARKILTPNFVRDVWGKHILHTKIEPIIVRILGLNSANETGLNAVHLDGVGSDVMDFLRTPNYTSEL